MSEGERERERYEWGERVSMHSVCVCKSCICHNGWERGDQSRD